MHKVQRSIYVLKNRTTYAHRYNIISHMLHSFVNTGRAITEELYVSQHLQTAFDLLNIGLILLVNPHLIFN
jgi:hypothetical protein